MAPGAVTGKHSTAVRCRVAIAGRMLHFAIAWPVDGVTRMALTPDKRGRRS